MGNSQSVDAASTGQDYFSRHSTSDMTSRHADDLSNDEYVLTSPGGHLRSRSHARRLIRSEIFGDIPVLAAPRSTIPHPPPNLAERLISRDRSAINSQETLSGAWQQTLRDEAVKPIQNVALALEALQRLEAIASPADLSLLRQALVDSPHDYVINTTEIGQDGGATENHIVRRKSAYTPGIATRPGSSPTSNPCITNVKNPPWGRQIHLESPLTKLADLHVARAPTPSEQNYPHLGPFEIGSLRITNGAASPDLSVVGPAISKMLPHDAFALDEYYTASEGSVGEEPASSKDAPESRLASSGKTFEFAAVPPKPPITTRATQRIQQYAAVPPTPAPAGPRSPLRSDVRNGRNIPRGDSAYEPVDLVPEKLTTSISRAEPSASSTVQYGHNPVVPPLHDAERWHTTPVEIQSGILHPQRPLPSPLSCGSSVYSEHVAANVNERPQHHQKSDSGYVSQRSSELVGESDSKRVSRHVDESPSYLPARQPIHGATVLGSAPRNEDRIPALHNSNAAQTSTAQVLPGTDQSSQQARRPEDSARVENSQTPAKKLKKKNRRSRIESGTDISSIQLMKQQIPAPSLDVLQKHSQRLEDCPHMDSLPHTFDSVSSLTREMSDGDDEPAVCLEHPVENPMRFPSPERLAEDAPALLSKRGRRSRRGSLIDEKNPRGFFRSKSRRRSKSLHPTPKLDIDNADELVTIADFGSVPISLGESPYDFVRSQYSLPAMQTYSIKGDVTTDSWDSPRNKKARGSNMDNWPRQNIVGMNDRQATNFALTRSKDRMRAEHIDSGRRGEGFAKEYPRTAKMRPKSMIQQGDNSVPPLPASARQTIARRPVSFHASRLEKPQESRPDDEDGVRPRHQEIRGGIREPHGPTNAPRSYGVPDEWEQQARLWRARRKSIGEGLRNAALSSEPPVGPNKITRKPLVQPAQDPRNSSPSVKSRAAAYEQLGHRV